MQNAMRKDAFKVASISLYIQANTSSLPRISKAFLGMTRNQRLCRLSSKTLHLPRPQACRNVLSFKADSTQSVYLSSSVCLEPAAESRQRAVKQGGALFGSPLSPLGASCTGSPHHRSSQAQQGGSNARWSGGGGGTDRAELERQGRRAALHSDPGAALTGWPGWWLWP